MKSFVSSRDYKVIPNLKKLSFYRTYMNDKATYNRPRTVKLDKDEDFMLQQHCSMLGFDVSTFIREAIHEKISSGIVSSVAGQNIIDYNLKRDNFIWKVKLDDGEEKSILEDISVEFLQDLSGKIKLKLKERDELIGRKKKRSVAVPRRMVG